MIALDAHFDGKVIVPDEPLDLPANQKVRIRLEPIGSPYATEPARLAKRPLGQQRDVNIEYDSDWESPLPDDIWDHNRQDE